MRVVATMRARSDIGRDSSGARRGIPVTGRGRRPAPRARCPIGSLSWRRDAAPQSHTGADLPTPTARIIGGCDVHIARSHQSTPGPGTTHTHARGIPAWCPALDAPPVVVGA